jgi:hypothetical protein
MMKMIGSLPSFRFSRNPWLTLVAVGAVAWAAYQTAQLVLQGDTNGLIMAAMLFVGAGVVVAILNDWRRGLYLFFAWILFEDFVRKYLGNNMAIYFGKDFLVLVLYLSFFIARRANHFKRFKPPFLAPLLVFVWFGLLHVFNPASTSLFFGVMGMKLYFLYVPLMYIGYEFLKSEEELSRFFSLNAILIMIIVGLGIAQSIMGPSFLNPRVLQEDIRELATTYRVAPISGVMAYRPTSVFVSGGRFQDFLIVSWIISLGYAGYLLLRSRKGRLVAFLAVGVVAAGGIMSASRGVFMWNAGNALVISAAFIWGAPWRQGEARRVLRAIQRGLLFVGIAMVLLVTIFPEEIGSRFAIYAETLLPSSTSSELSNRIGDYPFKNLMLAFDHEHWVVGYGIGTNSLGVQYVTRIMHATPMRIGVENGYGQIMIELGIVGLLLWITLTIWIVISSWKVVKSLRGTPWFPFAFVIFWYAFTLLIPMSYIGLVAYQDFILNAYLWMLLGLLFRLPNLAHTAQTAGLAAQQAANLRQA